MDTIRNVAILGMGALGAALARQIAMAEDVRLYGIVRDIEAYWGAPILVDGEPLRVNYRSIETMPSVPMDLILLCVRSYDFEAAARLIRPLVGPGTILLPLTSGLGRAEALAALYGGEHVIPGAAPGIRAGRSSRYVTVSRKGVLWFGAMQDGQDEVVASLRAFFNACGIRHIVGARMDAVLWKSFLLEAVTEQASLVFQLPYGQLAASERARRVVREAQKEITSVARAYGVEPDACDLPSCEAYLASLPADGASRMLLDYRQSRRLEYDAYCDALLTLAEAKRLTLPACLWLREQVAEMVDKRSAIPFGAGQIRSLSSRQGLTATPEVIASRLRIDVLQGKFAPGTKLSENELATQFYASRSSVRSALQVLSGEGLLHTLPNGRREVCRFSEKELHDLFSLRYQLERMAAAAILADGGAPHPGLTEALEKIEQKYRSQSIAEEPEDLDVLFHRSLVQAAGNPFLVNAWDALARIWYATLYFSRQASTASGRLLELYGRHQHLYMLLAARDAAVLPELQRHIEEERRDAAAVFSAGNG